MTLDINALIPTQIRMRLIPRLVLIVAKITTNIRVPPFSCIDIQHLQDGGSPGRKYLARTFTPLHHRTRFESAKTLSVLKKYYKN